MRRFLPLLLLVVSVSVIHASEPPLEPIFNGKDLSGWNTGGAEDFWRIEDGILVGENVAGAQGHYLWTERSYRDFLLEFEVRWTGEIDSGIEMREPHLQLQLGVSRSLKRDMTGSFYVGKPGYPESGQAKTASRLLRPAGEWNTFRVEARGPTFTVWINGHPASQYSDDKFAGAGPIGLQIHGGLKMMVEYRNIRAAALPDSQ
jgi:hypothetical protein